MKPLVIGALAVGAFFLYSRRAAAAGRPALTPATRRTTLGRGKQQTGQTYATPTSMGDELARLVVGITRGVVPAQSTGLPTAPILPPGAPGGSGSDGTQGWNLDDLYGPITTAGANAGWAGPSQSLVNPFSSVSRIESSVDQIPAAPVYDPTVDYTTNPWNLWGNAP